MNERFVNKEIIENKVAWFKENKAMLKFCFLFGGFVVLFFSAAHSDYANKTIAIWYPEFITSLVGKIIRGMIATAGTVKELVHISSLESFFSSVTSISVTSKGQFVQGFTGSDLHRRAIFSMRIIYDCSGVFATSIYIAAVLAYPASVKEKLIGCLVGAPILAGVNIVRLACMFFIGVFFSKELFHFFHIYLWQGIFIIFVIVIWMLWSEFFVKAPEKS